MEIDKELLLKIRIDIREITRAIDIYNILINKRITEFEELKKIISIQLALKLKVIMLRESQEEVMKYIFHLTTAIGEELYSHYAIRSTDSPQDFIDEALSIIKYPEKYNTDENLVELYKNQSIILQEKLKKNLSGAIKDAKIGTELYILLGKFGLIMKMDSLNHFVCEKKSYNLIKTMIDLNELPFKLVCSND